VARQANGTTQYLVSASTLNLSAFNKMSFSFWIQINTLDTTRRYALNFGDDGTQNGCSAIIVADTSSLQQVFTKSVGGYTAIGFPYMTANVWHHMAVNIDFSVTATPSPTVPQVMIPNVWIDGTAITCTNTASSAASGPLVNGLLRLFSHVTGTNFLNGQIAEIAIYAGYLLTSTDVTNLRNAGAGRDPRTVGSGLAYYWPLMGTTSPEPALVGGIAMTVSGATSSTHPFSNTWLTTTFPSIPVLDSGIGVNNTPPPGWSGPIFVGETQLARVSNQITGSTTGHNSSYWATPMAAGTVAVSSRITAVPTAASAEIGIACRLINPNNAAINLYGYAFRNSDSSIFNEYYVFKYAGSPTSSFTFLQAGTVAPVTLAVNDWISMMHDGATLTVYYFKSGVWTVLNSYADSSVGAGQGYIGAWNAYTGGTACAINDFSGATAVSSLGVAPRAMQSYRRRR
jgi:hypothetical protein